MTKSQEIDELYLSLFLHVFFLKLDNFENMNNNITVIFYDPIYYFLTLGEFDICDKKWGSNNGCDTIFCPLMANLY